ncbi:MAG: aldo/keto reductase, partial [Pseudomonadota bacterium]
MLSRRSFLGTGTAAGVSSVVPSSKAEASPSIRRHVTLGKTGLKVSEIGFGSASSQDPDLVSHALSRGITFFDTAESYRFGWSEEAMGEGLKGVPRDQYVLTSKTKAGASDTEAEMMEALEGSLKRLQTDYVDIYFNHAVNSVDRMRNEAWAAFMERAREQGKIRFRAMSGHGS